MSVAQEFDPVAEEKRAELTRVLVNEATSNLDALRSKTTELEAGDPATWQAARDFAQHVIRAAGPLDLGLLSACAKEVLNFANRGLAIAHVPGELALIMLCALDTVEMELARLRADRFAR